MPHLYLTPPVNNPTGVGFVNDERTIRLFRVEEEGENLFIKYQASPGTVRISLLKSNLDVILNRHKRALVKFARRLGADIIQANLGSYLRDEKGLECLWREEDIYRFDWQRPAVRVLEVGSGNGGFLNRMAEENPDAFFLGAEINGFVLKKALRAASERSLRNIRYMKKNAELLLKYFIPEGALDAIYINFPDPWFKKRHHKRKLINPESVRLFARALKKGGTLFFTSDDPDYVTWCVDHFQTVPYFRLNGWETSVSPRFYTKYERKWLSEGKDIHALAFQRESLPVAEAVADRLGESFTLPAPHRLQGGVTLKEGELTVVFRDVYRSEGEDIIDTIVSLGRLTWMVVFTWESGELRYSHDLNHKYLPLQMKDYLARLLS